VSRNRRSFVAGSLLLLFGILLLVLWRLSASTAPGTDFARPAVGGSDRFVDANVAWGDEGAIRARIQLFWDAGADHVCIQSIHPSGSRASMDERIFDLLAPAGEA